jgi:hypothetical protein
MTRIIKIGAGGDELDWHEALKDLRADDVLLLEPGFYYLPQGLTLCDITLKGTGSLPEDTVINGYLQVSADSRFVNLENLCLKTPDDHNSLYVPAEADSYLSLRNCVIKGYGQDTAAIAANGKVTLELYSVKVFSGSVSFFKQADFRLEMNDSLIDYPSDKYCALAFEGHGTAIINNSQVKGSCNTFANTNMELDFNNSKLSYVLLHGQTWMNMLNSQLLSQGDSCLYVSDDSWVNIVNSRFAGGLYFDKDSHTIMQNSQLDRLIAVDRAQLTLNNSQIASHADFQDQVKADATRVSFNGSPDYEYFLALAAQAQLRGHDLVLNQNGAQLAVQDQAQFKANILASDQTSIEVECNQKPNVDILGMHWTIKKK